MNLRWGSRLRGAAAGLVPWLSIALLFLISGSAAGPAEVAGSLATVGAITVGAGWLAGPLADGPQRRLVAGGFGYAIAVLAVTLTLGAIQGGRDFPDGTDLLGIVALTVARVAYGALYLVLPAIALGMLWSVAAVRLRRVRMIRMKFQTTLEQSGDTATGIEVPEEVLTGLGRGRRVAVVATVNGYTYRTTVGPYQGRIMMPFSSGHRAASGLSGGDPIEVELVPDDAPREVEVPADLTAALANEPTAGAFFAGLSYSNRKSYVTWIEDAKKPETRSARVVKAVEMLDGGKTR